MNQFKRHQEIYSGKVTFFSLTHLDRTQIQKAIMFNCNYLKKNLIMPLVF